MPRLVRRLRPLPLPKPGRPPAFEAHSVAEPQDRDSRRPGPLPRVSDFSEIRPFAARERNIMSAGSALGDSAVGARQLLDRSALNAHRGSEACGRAGPRLTVRIVNWRERWSKWTLAAAIRRPVLYVLSFGPACRLIEEGYVSINSPWLRVYCQLAKLASSTSPSLAKDAICRWASAAGHGRARARQTALCG